MARLRSLLLLLLGCLLAGPSPTQDADPAVPQQIMVMLRLPPPHQRSGSAYSGGYGEDASRGARLRIAAQIARAHGLAMVENWPMPGLGIDCFIMAVADGRSIAQAAEDVGRERNVAWSEPVALYSAQGSAGTADTAAAAGDALYPAQPGAQLWPLAALHRSLTGRNVSVAVIDSGVDASHPDLAGQILLTRNFALVANKAERHGTAVAGVIAARAGNDVGIAGVAPNARILALRACWESNARTLCDSFSLAKAIQFAVDARAPIINLSLSGPPSRLLAMLLQRGLAQSQYVVAAVDPNLPDGGFPASLPGVLAVSNESKTRRPYLVYHAPGDDIPAPQPGGQWALVNGSSFSAAHVSGLLALLRQQRKTRPPPILAHSASGEIDICATFGASICSVAAAR